MKQFFSCVYDKGLSIADRISTQESRTLIKSIRFRNRCWNDYIRNSSHSSRKFKTFYYSVVAPIAERKLGNFTLLAEESRNKMDKEETVSNFRKKMFELKQVRALSKKLPTVEKWKVSSWKTDSKVTNAMDVRRWTQSVLLV